MINFNDNAKTTSKLHHFFFFFYTKLHHLSNYISFGQLQPIPEAIMTPTRTQKEIEIII